MKFNLKYKFSYQDLLVSKEGKESEIYKKQSAELGHIHMHPEYFYGMAEIDRVEIMKVSHTEEIVSETDILITSRWKELN